VIAFAKYHGLGNDFLVVDLREPHADADAIQDPAVVRAICDRQFGVGGDGILAILPPVTPGADARMRVLNSDGSEAEMCGNGLRCFAKYLYERGGVAKPRMVIDTGGGALACDLQLTRDLVESVTVDMGKPRFLRKEIPLSGPPDERCVDVPFALAGHDLRLTAVSTGNPHAVFFVNAPLMHLATSIGPTIETHPLFPKKTNVEFARIKSPTEIDLVVWERGCGITLACGTGACATTVAACLTGRAQVDTDVRVNLPGGSLSIRVAPDYRTVFMRGPATHVFDGSLAPRAIAPRP
jgi:diaminopimelate epimerase